MNEWVMIPQIVGEDASGELAPAVVEFASGELAPGRRRVRVPKPQCYMLRCIGVRSIVARIKQPRPQHAAGGRTVRQERKWTSPSRSCWY
jgi:hypothetical protein